MPDHPGTLPTDMQHRPRRPAFLGLLWLACLAFTGLQPDSSFAQTAPRPDAGDNTMPVDDVRIGMRGYGLTVFQGTEIEPFPVEVISINHTMGPKRSAIWIRSDDPRLAESGPVQGMSGSPIYLWPDTAGDAEPGDEHTIGDGGRLIGAFAFGFSQSKTCIAGVQPIGYMRQVGTRARDAEAAPAKRADASTNTGVTTARRTMKRLARLVNQHDGAQAATRLDAWQTLLDPSRATKKTQQNQQREKSAPAPAWNSASGQAPSQPASPALPPPPRARQDEGRVVPLMLPMSVGSARIASLVGPLLEPMGIEAVAANEGLVSGAPPASIDAEAAQLAPGSVLAVPLAFGDVDLSASGTVTDVGPDGTVLGFGHAMFGQGHAALPMATGFVHFVVPRLSTSFKLAGSLKIQGSILRDEVAAVAGRGVQQFATAPVQVDVSMPGRDAEQYNYQVVDHRRLTPMLATIVTLRSITAEHQPPPESTLYLSGQMQFSNGHRLNIDTMVPSEQTMAALMEITPPLMLAMQNPHQGLTLQSMQVQSEVVPQRRTGSIINARLEQSQVAPGDTVGVTVWVQPYGKSSRRLRTELEIPADLPEGDYPLIISDAQTYLGALASTRPHLFMTRNVDDLMQMIQRVLGVKRNAVHLTMRLPEKGIAVGRQELPQLPSSRRAMIHTPTSTVAQPYRDTLEKTIETDLAISGQLGFTVHVRRDETQTQPPPDERDEN